MGTASAAAAQMAAQKQSSWRLSKALLLEAWALRMYVLHIAGSDAGAVERVMEQVGIIYQRHEVNAMASVDAGGIHAPVSEGQSHTWRKSKHHSKHSRRSKKKRKRGHSESSSDELLPRDYTDRTALSPLVEWELEGLHGGGRTTSSYPHVADVISIQALTGWVREVEGR